MQFQVPQFIDVEDKVVGPFSWKEFVYLAGGAGVCILAFKIIPNFFIAFIVSAPFVVLALLLTFYRVNERPFIDLFQSMLSYLFSKKLYVWQQPKQKPNTENTNINKDTEVNNSIVKDAEKVLTPEKLRELTWSLDVLDKK